MSNMQINEKINVINRNVYALFLFDRLRATVTTSVAEKKTEYRGSS